MLDPGFLEALKKTEPNKIRQMPIEKLIEYEQYFAEQIPEFGLDAKHQQHQQQYQARMDLLRAEIQLRLLTTQSERQHKEAFGLGKRTLFWAKLAVVAAVVVPVILALISQFPFSKLLPAKTDKASPPTYLQTPAPTTASQEPEANYNNATPSPEQTAITTPLPSTP